MPAHSKLGCSALLSAILLLLLLTAPRPSEAVNIVLSNDDGWAEKNIRVLYDALTTTTDGMADDPFQVLISAPADNKSGTGSLDAPATVVSAGCEFDSCPRGSPAVGSNSSVPRFNYVNSYPVTSMRYGIQDLSKKLLGGEADLAVSGLNVRTNTGKTVFISGTVAAAVEASLLDVPGIAFSGDTGSQVAWHTPLQSYQSVYAALAANVTRTLVASGKPYLPPRTWLNVNFPASTAERCAAASDFKFVLSRIFPATRHVPPDAVTCGSDRLPKERDVVAAAGCYVSISVGIPNKKDADAKQQADVLDKLQPILSCLP